MKEESAKEKNQENWRKLKKRSPNNSKWKKTLQNFKSPKTNFKKKSISKSLISIFFHFLILSNFSYILFHFINFLFLRLLLYFLSFNFFEAFSIFYLWIFFEDTCCIPLLKVNESQGISEQHRYGVTSFSGNSPAHREPH